MHRDRRIPFASRMCAAALALAALPAVGAAQQAAPSGRALDQLVADYLEQDGRTDAGHARQVEILGQLAALPPLDAGADRKWRQKIAKLWKKGRKLEKAGDNWFWEERDRQRTERRGRYIVGGNTGRPRGLAITMHGGGLGSADAGPAANAYQPALDKLGWVMIAPEALEATEHGWTDSGTEEFVLELVDCALRTFKVDPNRVFLVGHSMGGYGSWTLGGHHADRVAAIAPSAGAPTPVLSGPGGKIIDIQEGVIPSLRNVFVSIYQSTDDPQVPPLPNQFAARKLLELQQRWGGFEHDYWEVTDRGHGAPPGGHLAQLEKIADRARDPVPARVVWQPVLPWKRQFYWLWWDAPARNAVVVADRDRAANAIAITCEQSTDGLWVLLDDRIVDLDADVVVTVNGAEVFRGAARRDLGTLLRTSVHPDPELQFAARVPAFAQGGG
ncbi:MAG: alpha/beta hydrolase-fold protein [Planctomycetota bacterium]